MNSIFKFPFYKNFNLILFAILLLFFLILIFFIDQVAFAQLVYKEYDTNGDGKIDRWIWLYNGFEQKVIMDLNYDGIPDAEYRYFITDNGSIPQFQQFDTNFDGKYDDFYYFENGKLVRQEIDSNFDGRVDIIIYIQDNYIYKIEQDKDFDGKFETVINY